MKDPNNKVKFEDLGGGRFRVDGRLDFNSVIQALETSKHLFAELHAVQLDLSGVSAIDSAGLALFVEWISRARRGNCNLVFSNVPAQAMAIARISDVEKLLPVAT
ncbi:MAG: STAS domain-containing protein [Gammaproteobacteria bacterium]|nr:STAS domain-containing protein [Gammaproteobacteria bacterium]MDE2345046.1 STAS domain-containing protein [Gammaproteobacteria bacterium]